MFDIDVESLKKQLNKNVDIVEATFEKFHLQLLGYGFCGIDTRSGWMQLLIELASEPGESLQSDVEIKVNFYDEDNVIIYSYSSGLYEEDFSGYDTIHMRLNEDNLAFNTTMCRIFMTRG